MSARTSETYRRFAEIEARGVSAVYESWAVGVAGDRTVLELIDTLPRMKRQPNLVFAAARFLGAPEGSFGTLRTWLLDRWADLERVVLTRSTQTNEAARCAALLPLISRVDGPVALIEVGASAGLCLYPDRYSYRYDVGERTVSLDPTDGPSDVVLRLAVTPEEAPSRLPQVVWRAGIDLAPVDPTDEDQLAWLEALVWPEHHERRRRLRQAADVAARDPVSMVRGDLVGELPALVERVPEGAHVVVFHSAVLVYLSTERRQAFVDVVRGMPDVTWISNEGAGVFPWMTEQIVVPVDGRTVLALDGVPHALVGPHGQSYERL